MTGLTGYDWLDWPDWPTLWRLAKTDHYCPDTGQLWLHWLILTWLANTVSTGLTSQTGQYCPNWLDCPDWPTLCSLAKTGRYCPETGQLWLNWLILTWLANTVPTGLTGLTEFQEMTGQYCSDWPILVLLTSLANNFRTGQYWRDWQILYRLAISVLTGQ